MNLIDEIARYLEAELEEISFLQSSFPSEYSPVHYDPEGINGNIFAETMAHKPDYAVGIFTGPGLEADAKYGYDRPGIQIIIRGRKDPRIPLQLGYDIYNILQGFSSGTFVDNGIWVVSCFCPQSGPVRLGVDENGRHEFSLNFDLEIRNPTKYRE